MGDKFLRVNRVANQHILFPATIPTQHAPPNHNMTFRVKMLHETGKTGIGFGRPDDSNFRHNIYVSLSDDNFKVAPSSGSAVSFITPASLLGKVVIFEMTHTRATNAVNVTATTVVDDGGTPEVFDLGTQTIILGAKPSGGNWSIMFGGTAFSEMDWYYSELEYFDTDTSQLLPQWSFSAESVEVGDTTITDSVNGLVGTLTNFDLSTDLLEDNRASTKPVITANPTILNVVQGVDTLDYTTTLVDSNGDPLDNNLIQVSGVANLDVVGQYILTLTYLTADPVQVTVNVLADITVPVLSESVGNQLIYVGGTYPTFNATGTDNGVDVSADIIETNDIPNDAVKTTTVRVNTHTFTYTDLGGNSAQLIRKVEVQQEFTTDDIGLQLDNATQRWVSLPVYTFPSSGVVTIVCSIYINTAITQAQQVFRLRNVPNEVSFSINSNGIGALLVQGDSDAEQLETGVFIQGGYYVITATINLDNGDITCDVNGSNTTASLSGVASLRGFTTTAGQDTSIGNSFGIIFSDILLYLLNINSQRNYLADAANGSGNVLIDTVGSQNGTIINPSANQWVGDITPIPNNPPTVSIDAITDIETSTTRVLTAAVNDVDGDTITYDWSVGAGTFDDNTLASPTYTAPSSAQGVIFNLSVSDGTSTVQTSRSATIVEPVQIPNRPPEVNISAPSSVLAGASITFTANASDLDNDDLTYLWSSGETSQFITVLAPSADEPSTVTRSVTVSDGELTDTSSATVNVAAQTDEDLSTVTATFVIETSVEALVEKQFSISSTVDGLVTKQVPISTVLFGEFSNAAPAQRVNLTLDK